MSISPTSFFSDHFKQDDSSTSDSFSLLGSSENSLSTIVSKQLEKTNLDPLSDNFNWSVTQKEEEGLPFGCFIDGQDDLFLNQIEEKDLLGSHCPNRIEDPTEDFIYRETEPHFFSKVEQIFSSSIASDSANTPPNNSIHFLLSRQGWEVIKQVGNAFDVVKIDIEGARKRLSKEGDRKSIEYADFSNNDCRLFKTPYAHILNLEVKWFHSRDKSSSCSSKSMHVTLNLYKRLGDKIEFYQTKSWKINKFACETRGDRKVFYFELILSAQETTMKLESNLFKVLARR
jgi:hypothetical protein